MRRRDFLRAASSLGAPAIASICTRTAWRAAMPSFDQMPTASTEHFHDIGRKFDVVFSHLMPRFSDVEFFASYRVVSLVAWARATNGESR
jgi:hypothetical protein